MAHLSDRKGSASEQWLCVYDGQEGVSTFKPEPCQKGLHYRHDGLIEIQPSYQTLQILLAETSVFKKHPSDKKPYNHRSN